MIKYDVLRLFRWKSGGSSTKKKFIFKKFPKKKIAKTGNARHKWAENVILASKYCVTEFRDTSHLFVHDCEKIPHAHNHANVLFWM